MFILLSPKEARQQTTGHVRYAFACDDHLDPHESKPNRHDQPQLNAQFSSVLL